MTYLQKQEIVKGNNVKQLKVCFTLLSTCLTTEIVYFNKNTTLLGIKPSLARQP